MQVYVSSMNPSVVNFASLTVPCNTVSNYDCCGGYQGKYESYPEVAKLYCSWAFHKISNFFLHSWLSQDEQRIFKINKLKN